MAVIKAYARNHKSIVLGMHRNSGWGRHTTLLDGIMAKTLEIHTCIRCSNAGPGPLGM